MTYTTIQLEKKISEDLRQVREHPRETYNETIQRLINLYKKVKKSNQYDEFLHKTQQIKMKELWDNEHDEDWNKA